MSQWIGGKITVSGCFSGSKRGSVEFSMGWWGKKHRAVYRILGGKNYGFNLSTVAFPFSQTIEIPCRYQMIASFKHCDCPISMTPILLRPTNHLSAEGCRFLEDTLRSARDVSLVLVSPDRALGKTSGVGQSSRRVPPQKKKKQIEKAF